MYCDSQSVALKRLDINFSVGVSHAVVVPMDDMADSRMLTGQAFGVEGFDARE